MPWINCLNPWYLMGCAGRFFAKWRLPWSDGAVFRGVRS